MVKVLFICHVNSAERLMEKSETQQAKGQIIHSIRKG